MKAAIYARVSKGDKQTPDNQLQQLTEWRRRLGWTPAGEYVDTDTGTTGSRPAFTRMFAEAREARFDVLLFWSLDRFSREGVRKTLDRLNALSALGIEYRSLQEQFFDTAGPFKDALIAIFATLAELESARMSERTKAGLARARASGKQIGAPRKLVRRAKLERLLSQGKPKCRIAAELKISHRTLLRRITELGL